MRDIESLDGHTSFLFGKINFLMDATVGFININQNKIVKIFSVASVALLPPTLIASIYGMNFRAFPNWNGVRLPVFAGTDADFGRYVPFWIFRRKGWLDRLRVAFCQHHGSTPIQESLSSYCPI